MPFEPVRPTLVEKAKLPPGKCAVTGDIDGPFIDCGIKYENNGYWTRLYLHAPWVEQVARDSLGMVPRSEIQDLARRVREAEAELEQIKLKAVQVDAAEKLLAQVA